VTELRLGLSLPVFSGDPRRCLDAARRAAAAGYHGAFSPDHLFPPGRPEAPTVEAWSLLAAVAAAEPRLVVGTLITRVGVRPAGMVAKQTSWLAAVASEAVLGMGVGDRFARAEHDALGLAFPPLEERVASLEETSLACQALFAGSPWPGGRWVSPITGPLTPPGSAEIWFGGLNERIVRAAARAADGWNGWQLDAEGFAQRSALLAASAQEKGRNPSDVTPTWGGIVLVGENAADLRSLETERASRKAPMDIWRGTRDDLRRFRDTLAASGATWMIAATAGPADRLELIADAFRS
jgi:alkanesulfonate monooxygenase SsuD/methylene tetrahydromethanopterin reductase-like flavin-dependent oxidoreductase (luciferase family)